MTKKNEQQDLKPEERIVNEWWNNLKKDKGRRAELRRAKTLEEVFFTQAYHSLYGKLKSTDWRAKNSIALIAGVLAQVETHTGAISFATQMASPGKSGQKACVSGLRFRRLLQNKTHADVFGPLLRIVRLLDKKANLKDLAQKLYWWQSDRTKRDWAFDYYGKAPTEV